MRNLLKHPLAKPVGLGLMQLGLLVAWGCGGMSWYLQHYVGWAVQQLRGTSSLWTLLPAILALGVAGTVAVLLTFQLPAIAVAVAEGVAHGLRRGRGDA